MEPLYVCERLGVTDQVDEKLEEATFSNPKPIEEYIAEHLILAANNDPAAPSVKKKNELERVAQASR